jgi:hypothetical protein
MKPELLTYTQNNQTRMAFGIDEKLVAVEKGFFSKADPAGRTLGLYLVSGREWGDDDDSPMIFAAYDEDEAIEMHKRQIYDLSGSDESIEAWADDDGHILLLAFRLGEAISADTAASLKEASHG